MPIPIIKGSPDLHIEPKYFNLKEVEGVHILSDRMDFKWLEVVIFPLSFFVLMMIIFSNPLIALQISIIVGLFYFIFRFFAFIYYTELSINMSNENLMLTKKLFNKTKSVEIITDKAEFENFHFQELKRSGKTKYLLKYKTYKDTNLLIIKTPEDKKIIENYLKKVLP